MTHLADFADAHLRHWEDAELLFEQGRWANADQLFGFSAECGLKRVMQALGMPVGETGMPAESEHRKHVQDLWSTFEDFAKDRGGARYLGLLPGGTPFADWSHHDRYANRRHFQGANVMVHREAARGIGQMMGAVAQDDSL